MTADEPILERQMSGCMAGFFHLFDRNYALASKRYVSPKRLLPIPDNESVSASERSDFSFSTEQSPKITSSTNRIMSGLEIKEKPWKLLELSRLSLDSRAVTDNRGKLQHRSPGAVARLMGLDALPDPDPKPAKLQRSASESRVRNDPSFYRFVDVSSFEKVSLSEQKHRRKSDNSFIQRKSFESFPEPRRTSSNTGRRAVQVSLYCEIERRLRVRGIEEPAKDLETLKRVLEAVQLRGLLHSSQPSNRKINDSSSVSPPLVLMKPKTASNKSPRQPRRDLRSEKKAPQAVRYNNERRAVKNIKNDEGRTAKTPAVKSPLGSPRKVGLDGVNKYGRRRNGEVRRYQKSYNLEGDERTGGDLLLERCDKLLSSIAAITSSDVSTGEDLQPSPVSVLDSVFLEEERSPFPHSKRSLHFHDQSLDRDFEASTVGFEPCNNGFQSDDPDFPYVAKIVQASNHHDPLDLNKIGLSDVDTSLHNRLLLDLVKEILDRQHNVSTHNTFLRSKSFSNSQKPIVQTVWQEILTTREPIIADDLNDFTCTAVCKDMARDHAWTHHSVEISDAVVQIERLIFKDLVADTIREFADVAVIF
ncbi:hypothetical protein LUZ60_005862 [Juncus effusus]|nr:hypothetical protein LUZ60_005862 [Juncus effusus]